MNKEGLGRLLAYTEWANHRVIRAAAALPLDDWKRDLKSSHGGVRGTLTHTMWAEWVWLERWKGLPNPAVSDEGEFPDVTVLSERWRVLNGHRHAWFRTLSESTVAAPLPFRLLNGTQDSKPLWQLVQHLANHSTYHRGQVTSLLREVGGRTVGSDLVLFDRENAAKG